MGIPMHHKCYGCSDLIQHVNEKTQFYLFIEKKSIAQMCLNISKQVDVNVVYS